MGSSPITRSKLNQIKGKQPIEGAEDVGHSAPRHANWTDSPKAPTLTAPPSARAKSDPLAAYRLLAESFRRSLLAENKAPRTVETYCEAVRLLGDLLAGQGMPTQVAYIRREHVESWIADLLAKWKPATANNRYRALQAFFKWLVEEGEIKQSPLANMKPPAIPETPPPILTKDQLRKLLKTCDGRDFFDRRDMAIIRLLIDTGMRRNECANLKVEDIDFETNVALVVGKGRRPRACAFGRKTAQALDRYLRARAQHRDAELPNLWLGHLGPMTPSGVYQVVRDRAREAGIGHAYTHLLRHTFAHQWLANVPHSNQVTSRPT